MTEEVSFEICVRRIEEYRFFNKIVNILVEFSKGILRAQSPHCVLLCQSRKMTSPVALSEWLAHDTAMYHHENAQICMPASPSFYYWCAPTYLPFCTRTEIIKSAQPYVHIDSLMGHL